MVLQLVPVGWAANPTGEGAAQLSPPLAAAVAGLERSWHRPARREPAAAPPAAPPPPPPPHPKPCPSTADRYRLAAWDASGWLPAGVTGSAIAAAYRRRFKAEPPRDPRHRCTRAYSLRELGHALGELGLSLAPNPRQGVQP